MQEEVKLNDMSKEIRLNTADKHMKSATTAEQDLHTASQRYINLIWEFTQALISLLIVVTTCAGIFVGRVIQTSNTPFPAEWWTIVGLVIGFYFGRTNHARGGGVQNKQRDR